MKKLLCLLTLLLMCSVSFGATTETATKKEIKVLVIGTVTTFEEVAKAVQAFKDLGSVTVVAIEQAEKLKQEIECLKYEIGNYAEGWEYVPPLITERPKYFYTAVAAPVNSKPIGIKAKHFRKSRDAI